MWGKVPKCICSYDFFANQKCFLLLSSLPISLDFFHKYSLKGAWFFGPVPFIFSFLLLILCSLLPGYGKVINAVFCSVDAAVGMEWSF